MAHEEIFEGLKNKVREIGSTPALEPIEEQDEIENAEDAIRELAQTDLDAEESSIVRAAELLKGIGFNDRSDDAEEWFEEVNKAFTEIALDLGIVQEENIPDDLLSDIE